MVSERVAEDECSRRRLTEMFDPSDPKIRMRAAHLHGWRAVAAVVAGLTVLVGVAAFLALGFLFIALPTMVVGAVVYYFLPNRPGRTLRNLEAEQQIKNTTIIEGNYSVTNETAGEAEDDHK
jgi:hypothetical protein